MPNFKDDALEKLQEELAAVEVPQAELEATVDDRQEMAESEEGKALGGPCDITENQVRPFAVLPPGREIIPEGSLAEKVREAKAAAGGALLGGRDPRTEVGSAAWLADTFSYHAPTPDQLPKYESIREAGKQLAMVISVNCPPSADRTAALRKVREAVMTANASVALGGRA